MKIKFTLSLVSPCVAFLAFGLASILAGCSGQTSANRSEAVAPAVQEKALTKEDSFAQLQKKAETGNAEAQFNLGWIYLHGEGSTRVTFIRDVPRDMTKAHEWYQKAAAQGHVNAQYNLGMLYKLGLGVKADAANAYMWLQKAAAQGNDIAQYHLGTMYADGTGVERHLPRACAWLILAAAQNNERARKDILEIDAKLTAAQRDECRQLSTSWKKGEII